VAETRGFVGVYQFLTFVVAVLVAGTVALGVTYRIYAQHRSHAG